MSTSPSLVSARAPARLLARPVPFASIPRASWDRLLQATPAATPFGRWTTHRAWWDAYGDTAHEQYLVCVADEPQTPADAAEELAAVDADRIRAILPLMHRHAVEPNDATSATALRRSGRTGAGVDPDAKVVFFGASYHADYATVLCSPEDLDDAAGALVSSLCAEPDMLHGAQPWDALDLRRLRDDDPALPALERAFRDAAVDAGWQVIREQEDVCPVVTIETDDWETYLGSLDKKARHEIRRKLRRAESAGPVRFTLLDPTPEVVDAFIELHQARWGEQGLFPDTQGGSRSRTFLHRLAALEREEGAARQMQFGRVNAGERTICATVGFDDGSTCYFYNAGMDPSARDLSPGVTGAAAYLRDRLEAGRRRFDFLRGDEAYKYEWGAVDEPIHRLLVTRNAAQ